MAINLYSMSLSSKATEATLIKPNASFISHKLNADKVKEDFKSIQAKNLNRLHQGSHLDDEIGAIYTGSIDRSVKLNHTAEAFFQERQPAAAEDGTYTIMGASFTEDELQQARFVLRSAAESINAGIGKGTNLDYNDYAQMGISLSAVKAYAERNLGAEQSDAVISAMEQYNEALISMEQEFFSKGNFVSTNYEGVSEYYGKGNVLSESDVKVFNELIDEMNRLSGGSRGHMSAGTVATVQSATNKGLINSISSLFSNLDLSNKTDVNAAMSQYKALMSPVYKTMGFKTSDGSLQRILDKETTAFMTQIKDLLSASAYRSVDLSL